MENILEKYTIRRVIGRGSFAEVYLVTRKYDYQPFAVKQIRKKDPKQCAKTNQECEIMKILRKRPHPNIIRMEEIHEDDDNIYIVQEYAAGGDLLGYLKDHQVGEDELKKIMKGLLSAVAHLHSLGIVHRDLKLENILLDADLMPRLADFGLSCYWNPSSELHSFCGSPMYCAPEMIKGAPYKGPEVDVWSCGVILFACMWNRFPFPLERNLDYQQAVKNLFKEITEKDVELPKKGCPNFKAIIRGMMTKDKEQRLTIKEAMNNIWFGEQSAHDEVASKPILGEKRKLEMSCRFAAVQCNREALKHQIKRIWSQLYHKVK